MWAGGGTDIHDDGIGSFLHLFHESAKIRENFKGMSTETDTAEEQHLIRPYPANVENMVS